MAVVNILLIEDDDVDVMAVKRAFRDLRIANPLHTASDGLEALDMLRGANGHSRLPQPLIVLLDLNMPRMNGLEFLDAVRQDDALHRLIIFVMTTSAAEEDRVRAYDKNVAGYVLKHSPGRSFLDAIAMIEHYWKVVELPE